MVISDCLSVAMASPTKPISLVEPVLLSNKTEADELVAVSEKHLLKLRSRLRRKGPRNRTTSFLRLTDPPPYRLWQRQATAWARWTS